MQRQSRKNDKENVTTRKKKKILPIKKKRYTAELYLLSMSYTLSNEREREKGGKETRYRNFSRVASSASRSRNRKAVTIDLASQPLLLAAVD